MDTVASVEFDGPFDPKQTAFRDAFRPFSYQPLDIAVDDSPVLTGTLVPVVPRFTAGKSTVAAGGYSRPGVLGECTAPVEAFPLDLKGQNLHEIATALASLFGLSIDAQTDPGPVFDRVALKPHEKILPFLAGLAKQRGQIISSNEVGDLLFWEAVDMSFGAPAATLTEGEPPLLSVVPSFNPSDFYSQLTGLKPVRVRSKKSIAFTVRNTLLPDVFRPFNFSVPDVKDADIEPAVQARNGRMLGNAVSYTVEMATWRDPTGELWAPNTIVRITAPHAMIYSEYDFLIRSVVFRKDPNKETAQLDVVVPGSFSGVEPGEWPWEE